MTSITAEPSILEMAKELVEAQIQTGNLSPEDLSPEDLSQALADTHAQLLSLQTRSRQGESAVVLGPGQPPVAGQWRQSISQYAITCLECGLVFKQLSKRHLGQHDLTVRLYREKYRMPKATPLAARATTARRRAAVQATRPWEKTPRYLETQAAAAPKQPAPKRKRQAAKRSESRGGLNAAGWRLALRCPRHGERFKHAALGLLVEMRND